MNDLATYHLLHLLERNTRRSGETLRRRLAVKLSRRVAPLEFAELCDPLLRIEFIDRCSSDEKDPIRSAIILGCMMPSHLHYWITDLGVVARTHMRIANVDGVLRRPRVAII